MLITPRLYRLSQTPDKGARNVPDPQSSNSLSGWQISRADVKHARKMLLVHQAGSVRVGEVVRYTLTYTPSQDRILPSPSQLHVKIRNTSAIPLRAAYLHGPYTLYVACYPSTFDPNRKHEAHKQEGSPEFEPNLKAGGSWNSTLTVPEDVRETVGGRFVADADSNKSQRRENFTWIIEIASQVIFSTSATVHFEVLVGRDRRSTELGFGALTGTGQGTPAQIHDHPLGKNVSGHSRKASEARGIYSKAVDLVVDDTGSLWNSPTFPSWDDEPTDKHGNAEFPDPGDQDILKPETEPGKEGPARKKSRKRKHVHLVVLTHGLHSNLGADMLYLKESIDVAAKQAQDDARKHKAEFRKKRTQKNSTTPIVLPSEPPKFTNKLVAEPVQEEQDEESDDEEQVIVRGFSGNAVRTERGIQYLGKRLAKYILHMTYPDQPYLPVKSSMKKSLSRTFTGQQKASKDGKDGPPVHSHSSVHREHSQAEREDMAENLPHKITSISFISHSLGGLIQTYAIAYVQKHSPHFFDTIKPINFVAMASPFLGLSNENPIYVKFALDFGLVGRTGQDLGLTWRAPAVVRSGWAQMIGGLGKDAHDARQQSDPGSKPLLRVLPTGPAHQVLKKFRNRTLYSNVVNDGIVPLRTSCLLFLDWRGLGRVEKARRENGLVGTMAGWGWAELTGANSSSHRIGFGQSQSNDGGGESGSEGATTPTIQGHGDTVPQPSDNETQDDNDSQSYKGPMAHPDSHQFLNPNHSRDYNSSTTKDIQPSPLGSLFSFFKPSSSSPPKSPHPSTLSNKKAKIYKRSQTVRINAGGSLSSAGEGLSDTNVPAATSESDQRPQRIRGDSLYGEDSDLQAPPKTTFFESAGDILNPPLPPTEFLIDPSSRPRTIFHDRIYHPSDIPPPALKHSRSMKTTRSLSSNSVNQDTTDPNPQKHPSLTLTSPTGSHSERPHSAYPPSSSDTPRPSVSIGPMKVEEKIARAYHHDLSWRKVLVRLEPDAHNNMVVRRMFANAYGWPVVKHLVDTHFAYTVAAETADEVEPDNERAKPMTVPPTTEGEEVKDQVKQPSTPIPDISLSTRSARSESELRESHDEVPEIVSPTSMSSVVPAFRHGSDSSSRASLMRQESGRWSDRFFQDSETDDDSDVNVDYSTGVVISSTKSKMKKAFKGVKGWKEGKAGADGDGAADGEDDIEIPHDNDDNLDLAKKGTTKAEIAEFLRTGPASKPAESRQREEELEPEEVAKSSTTEDMTTLPPLTGGGVGLGHSPTITTQVEIQGNPDVDRARLHRSESVSETVARLSLRERKAQEPGTGTEE